MNHQIQQRISCIQKQIDYALLHESVDLAIVNGYVFNVFTREFEFIDVGISQGRIVSLGKNIPAKEVFDANHQYILPGMIDAHTHIESTLLTPLSLDEALIRAGTTTIIADPHEIANVSGLKGIQFMLDEAEQTLTDMYFMLPSCVPSVPIDPSYQTLDATELAKLADHPKVLGLAEVMDEFGVIHKDLAVMEKLAYFHNRIIDGHAPNLSGTSIAAYASTRIKTDHECSTVEQLEQRIRLGMYVAIREGSASKNMKELLKGVNDKNMHRCMFCTDDIHPQDILNHGHILALVREAVSYGLDIGSAICMATFNPATCYQLKDVGAIALNYQADLVIVDNLTDFNPKHTIKKGVLYKPKQQCNVETSKIKSSILVRKLTLDQLEDHRDQRLTKVIVMQKDSLLTSEMSVDLSQEEDIVSCVVINRYQPDVHHFIGYVKGSGLKHGAIATSVSHDAHHILAIGTNNTDLLLAINTVINHHGGFVLALDNEVLDALYLPIGGLMSDQPIEQVASKMEELQQKSYNQLGFNHSILAITFLGLPVIGEIKMNVNGYVSVSSQTIVSKNVT